MKNAKALILTVGTGYINDLETSLLTPLKKSISKGEWKQVILLPSQVTKQNAAELESMIGDKPMEVRPLPKAGQEDDADACFHHFDSVIAGLLTAGFQNHNIVADFTRGTKAMSAALVLASIRREVSALRYITSLQRDERGQVLPGTEVIKEINPQIAITSARLDTALRFISHGAFAAAFELLPDPSNSFIKLNWPEPVLPLMSAIRSMAQFYVKWDKFDYKGAFSIASSSKKEWNEAKAKSQAWEKYFPVKEMLKWTQDLSASLTKGHRAKAPILRKMAADILANAERRARDGLFEDAAVRAYRIRELVAQIRLFERGIDPDDISKDLAELKETIDKLEKEGRSWHPGGGGKYQAGREKAALLLRTMKDPLADELLDEPDSGILCSKSRNKSLLIHGFKILGDMHNKKLQKDFKVIETLLRKDDPENASENLRQARLINFGVPVSSQ